MVKPPHATAGSEIGDQELAIACHGNAVWQETRRGTDNVLLLLADFDDAGIVVPHKKLALGGREHAFWPLQALPDPGNGGERDQRLFRH